MIVRRRAEGLLIVRQTDHQAQCLLMAEAWGNGAFGRPAPFPPLEAAAALHDGGWRTWEAEPEVGPDGAPVDFPDLDRTVHVGLYRASVAEARAFGSETGLLVSMHGQGLYERRLGLDGAAPDRADQPPAVRDFLAEQEVVQAELRAEIGEGPGLAAWAWDAYRVLQALDLLSLSLIWRGPPDGRETRLPAVPRAAGDPGVDIAVRPDGLDRATLEPWPFAADEVYLPVDARVVADRRYHSHEDLREALAAAPFTRWDYRVRRPTRT